VGSFVNDIAIAKYDVDRPELYYVMAVERILVLSKRHRPQIPTNLLEIFDIAKGQLMSDTTDILK
jgi:hypothetical protein